MHIYFVLCTHISAHDALRRTHSHTTYVSHYRSSVIAEAVEDDLFIPPSSVLRPRYTIGSPCPMHSIMLAKNTAQNGLLVTVNDTTQGLQTPKHAGRWKLWETLGNFLEMLLPEPESHRVFGACFRRRFDVPRCCRRTAEVDTDVGA
jgi:hypothetical protein